MTRLVRRAWPWPFDMENGSVAFCSSIHNAFHLPLSCIARQSDSYNEGRRGCVRRKQQEQDHLDFLEPFGEERDAANSNGAP